MVARAPNPSPRPRRWVPRTSFGCIRPRWCADTSSNRTGLSTVARRRDRRHRSSKADIPDRPGKSRLDEVERLVLGIGGQGRNRTTDTGIFRPDGGVAGSGARNQRRKPFIRADRAGIATAGTADRSEADPAWAQVRHAAAVGVAARPMTTAARPGAIRLT